MEFLTALKFLRGNTDRLDSMILRSCKGIGIGIVADYQGYLGIGDLTGVNCIQNCLEVGTAS